MRSPTLAAVVLNYRTPEDTLATLRSLRASSRAIDDLIVVNNDAADRDGHPLSGMASRVVHTGRNLGFSGGMNAGIRAALDQGAERVLLANSDVTLLPECLERLSQALDASDRIGIAGPVVVSRSKSAEVESLGISYSQTTGRMRHQGFRRAVASLPLTDTTTVDAVSGCLMLISRRVFDTVGLFDEAYFFSFEDLDFCLRARHAGFSTVLAGTATVLHEGSRTMGSASPRRFYFAVRNHLLLADRVTPSPSRLGHSLRATSIVCLNVAHAVASGGPPLSARLNAVARGTRDYLAGRFGED